MRNCYLCGRKGIRQFKWQPEVTVDHLPGITPFTVGGWWECAAEEACRRRRDRLNPRIWEDADV